MKDQKIIINLKINEKASYTCFKLIQIIIIKKL